MNRRRDQQYGVINRIPITPSGMFGSVQSSTSTGGGFRCIITNFRRDRRVKHHVATLIKEGDSLSLRCKCRWKASYASEEILREEHRKHVSGEDSFLSMFKV